MNFYQILLLAHILFWGMCVYPKGPNQMSYMIMTAIFSTGFVIVTYLKELSDGD